VRGTGPLFEDPYKWEVSLWTHHGPHASVPIAAAPNDVDDAPANTGARAACHKATGVASKKWQRLSHTFHEYVVGVSSIFIGSLSLSRARACVCVSWRGSLHMAWTCTSVTYLVVPPQIPSQRSLVALQLHWPRCGSVGRPLWHTFLCARRVSRPWRTAVCTLAGAFAQFGACRWRCTGGRGGSVRSRTSHSRPAPSVLHLL